MFLLFHVSAVLASVVWQPHLIIGSLIPQTHISISWKVKVLRNAVWETLTQKQIFSGKPEGSIPGPSRSAFFINDLEEDICCLLIHTMSYSNSSGLGNELGDRVRMS